jgi:hypothetical protein
MSTPGVEYLIMNRKMINMVKKRSFRIASKDGNLYVLKSIL